MITPEGIQRILDYYIFRHNFGKFHEYQELLQTSYEEFIIILTEIPNKRKMTGHHHSFKSEFQKLDMWYGNYQRVWNEFFAII